MNKTAIRNYAVWARTALIEAVTQKAFEYEIKEGQEMVLSLDSIDGRLLSANEKEWRRNLIDEIKRKSFTQVMEEVAYTWFNRFIALRYMEVNGFIPSRVRVFTNENGEFKPDILKEAMTVEIEGIDRAKVIDLLEKQNNEELFKYLIITQCNALNQGLPYMFEKISNWTELLFPSNLLRTDSIIGRMVNEIPEEDWQDAVQIIGWMYQFYNIEPKAKVFAKNGKITKEEIPAATQLFTPEWIVKYMVENSLGKLWIEGHPDENLKANWKYYLEEAEQESDVEVQLQKIREEYANVKPEDIKIIDPCMGSGHILVYAFDVLMQIYVANGYSEREAAKLILENNLFGLDIDDRAGQLAYFAVMMKARKYSRRILNGETKPNVLAIQDASFMNDDFINYVAGKDQTVKTDLMLLYSTFKDTKEYGSILNVPEMNFTALYERIDIISRSFAEDMFQMEYQKLSDEKLLLLVKQAEIMHQKYDVTVTNPPYMSVSGAGAKLNSYVVKKFPDSKTDMFAVFIERCGQMLKKNGFQAMITMHSWMFLSSYEKLRAKLLHKDTINMAHLGARAFEEIGGEVVQTTAFVLRNTHTSAYKGTYCRLIEPNTQNGKEIMFLSGENRYQADQSDFCKIPGSPFAYWVSERILELYNDYPALGKLAAPRKGNSTSDNNRFLRLWYEVNCQKMNLGCVALNREDTLVKRWFPYNKGGGYRKWYGYNEYLIDWYDDAAAIRSIKTAVIANYQYFMKPGLTWSTLSSNDFSIRWFDEGFIFDNGGCCVFDLGEKRPFILALLNSKVFRYVFGQLNPTLNFQSGEVAKFPIIYKVDEIINCKATENVELSKNEYNSFETSWDFKKHPLI